MEVESDLKTFFSYLLIGRDWVQGLHFLQDRWLDGLLVVEFMPNLLFTDNYGYGT